MPVSGDATPLNASLFLHTDLLGDLVLPGSVFGVAELPNLATRAA